MIVYYVNENLINFGKTQSKLIGSFLFFSSEKMVIR